MTKHKAKASSSTNAPSTETMPRIKAVEVADVVISLNGRDEGKRFVVVCTDNEYSMIADGKGRKIDKPKKKKNKHIKVEEKIDDPIAAKLISAANVTNNEIRRALAQFAATRVEKGGM